MTTSPMAVIPDTADIVGALYPPVLRHEWSGRRQSCARAVVHRASSPACCRVMESSHTLLHVVLAHVIHRAPEPVLAGSLYVGAWTILVRPGAGPVLSAVVAALLQGIATLPNRSADSHKNAQVNPARITAIFGICDFSADRVASESQC